MCDVLVTEATRGTGVTPVSDQLHCNQHITAAAATLAYAGVHHCFHKTNRYGRETICPNQTILALIPRAYTALDSGAYVTDALVRNKVYIICQNHGEGNHSVINVKPFTPNYSICFRLPTIVVNALSYGESVRHGLHI